MMIFCDYRVDYRTTRLILLMHFVRFVSELVWGVAVSVAILFSISRNKTRALVLLALEV